MSTYSQANFDSSRYENARPDYPLGFYRTLLDYHQSKSAKNLALDVGTGTGFVARRLLEYFETVIATDISPTMIRKCISSSYPQNIAFVESPAEVSPAFIETESVDLVTGAECCHWVDHEKFFKEVHRILKPNGTLAFWFYGEPRFIEYPEANEIYMKYTFGSHNDFINGEPFERYMGPYWEQPGRNYLRNLMNDVSVPTSMFKDIVKVDHIPNSYTEVAAETTLLISKRMNLQQLATYMKSWSAYHSWMKDNSSRYDIVDTFIEELKSRYGWNDKATFTLEWETSYTFARKKEENKD